jgi:hypothetical protein
MRHAAAYLGAEVEDDLEAGGPYQWRQRGERHLHNPTTTYKPPRGGLLKSRPPSYYLRSLDPWPSARRPSGAA